MSVFDSNLCCVRSYGRTVKHIISNYKTKKEESENNNYSSSMTNQNIVNMQIQSLSMLQVIEPMCCMCSKTNTYIPKFNKTHVVFKTKVKIKAPSCPEVD